MSRPPRRLAMVQWDVFSSRPLEGNSLAVFLDGRGLTDPEMQALAKEMNLSETTFVLPRDSATERERGIRVRIFTVREELPFAGHPTLGTAFALRGRGTKTGLAQRSPAAAHVVLELNVGKVPVSFEDSPDAPAFGEMTQVNPTFGIQHAREAIARATGVRIEDFDDSLPIETVSTGLPYTVTPLKSLAVIRDSADRLESRDRISDPDRGQFFLFRHSRDCGSRSPAPCPHALLQRRGPGHGLGRRLHRGMDGGARRGQARRTSAH